MDNYILPADPADPRPDFALWSGWPTRPTHLTTNPDRAPALYAVDMLECYCGAHVWIAADGRRWNYGTDPELHRCPDQETPLEAAEATFERDIDYSDIPDTSRDDRYWKGGRIGPVLPETLAETPPFAELVIE